MKVQLMTEVDCYGMPVTAVVEAEVPTGSDELDLALYDAMSTSLRLLAKAARDDQQRKHDEAAAR